MKRLGIVLLILTIFAIGFSPNVIIALRAHYGATDGPTLPPEISPY